MDFFIFAVLPLFWDFAQKTNFQKSFATNRTLKFLHHFQLQISPFKASIHYLKQSCHSQDRFTLKIPWSRALVRPAQLLFWYCSPSAILVLYVDSAVNRQRGFRTKLVEQTTLFICNRISIPSQGDIQIEIPWTSELLEKFRECENIRFSNLLLNIHCGLKQRVDRAPELILVRIRTSI